MFDLHAAHLTLVIRAHSVLEVTAPAWPAPRDTPAWELASVRHGAPAALRDPAIAPFAFASAFVNPDAGVGGFVRASFPAGRWLLEGLLEVLARMRSEFTCDAQATELSTDLRSAFAARRGSARISPTSSAPACDHSACRPAT